MSIIAKCVISLLKIALMKKIISHNERINTNENSRLTV